MLTTLLDDARRVVADVLGLPAEQIGDDASQETLAGWDSLQHLNIALSIETRFGVSLSPAEIESMRSLRAIVELLEAKRR
ncbi:MAG TPA: acyl carrier protein [Phycisphaerae bacterium]|nr:acyl carrier protein [Phycisphaerae bacterium]HOJ72410.1 acyl carrier protein [Phycisphaerae bacterium]HOM49928.1 acyl carrier protein [Phycisphaerae bacterium]HON68720.1 acyl carrier protein [Phycisphaerae bacterium]HOQ86546.1 acyl carrier protein [Phycisphaerae bacterium]